MTAQLYDPLTYNNLMEGLVSYFKQQDMKRMDSIEGVEGPGIYSLFYSGDMAVYEPIAAGVQPIYVGKAVTPGSRKGASVDESNPALQRRIHEHAKSIRQADNLEVSDFSCRYLAVVPVWITLAERFLIQYYRPVWNLCLDGFGDHDPGKGRRNSQRSWWDTLHPGREWASRLEGGKRREDAEWKVTDFFATPAHVGKNKG